MSHEPTTAAAREAPLGAVARASSVWRELAAPVAVWLALVTLVAWWALTRHPVGDYNAESDFYTPYAAGARLFQRGVVDFRRYSVVGPVYELLLGAVGAVTRDLFLAARLISLAAAAIALASVGRLAFAITHRTSACVAMALLALNPTFFRYGYSATTDMLALALGLLALSVASLHDRPRSAIAAGVALAVATLTRYSNVVMVAPFAMGLALRRAASGTARRLATGVVAMAAVLALWTIPSLVAGELPGSSLIRLYDFYANTGPMSQGHDVRQDLDAAAPPIAPGQPPMLLRPLLRLVPHARQDAQVVLGWPLAIAALFGAFTALPAAPLGRMLLAHGVIQFAMLLSVFWSERYALVLVPVAAVAGAAGLDRLPLAPLAPGMRRIVVGTLCAGLIASSAWACWRAQRAVSAELPVETIAAGRALASDSRPGDAVASRKAHVGYYADRPTVMLPRTADLAELAADLRRSRATHLYYSWYETQLRPELAFLLDSSAVVPGLARVHESQAPPAVLLRITPEFGAAPAWAADSFATRVHNARGMRRVHGDALPWPHTTVLAVDALARDAPVEALVHAERSLRQSPGEWVALLTRAQALQRLQRPADAADAFAAALVAVPDDPIALLGLGESLHAIGRRDEAARAWARALVVARDTPTLTAIAEAAQSAGERALADSARARIRLASAR